VAFIDTIINQYTFPRFILYFVLGMTAGLYVNTFRNVLMRFQKWYLPMTIVFALAKILEAGYRFSSGLDGIPQTGPSAITMTLYSLSMIALLLSRDALKPFSNVLTYLGGRTYGIYLVHYVAIAYLGKVIYHYAPQLLANQYVLFPIFLAFGLSAPVAAIAIARRIPVARRVLGYVFG
jgi:peptidoglycan/LPS O-acetylase OafA/YrhL